MISAVVGVVVVAIALPLYSASTAAVERSQREVDALWKNSPDWHRKAIHNVARMGWFSSDRTIAEYAKDIWKV